MAIHLLNIKKTYSNKNGSFILNIPNLFLQDDTITGFLGRSGSGKSTLLNIIGLIDSPNEGKVMFDRKNVVSYSERRKTNLRRENIGYIFQHYNLLENETALYNAMLPLLIRGVRRNKAMKLAIQMFEDFSMGKILYSKKCKYLSGGEKQRVAIIRALITNPSVIIADEPTGALDEANGEMMMSLLDKYKRGRLVIIVSHNKELIDKYCDRVIVLNEGEIQKDIRKNIPKKPIKCAKKKKSRIGHSWIKKLLHSNLMKRKTRNILSIVTLSFSILCGLLFAGFYNGIDNSLEEYGRKQVDYGVGTIYKENVFHIEGSNLSISQQSKLSFEELSIARKENEDFIITPNYDALINSNLEISIDESVTNDLSLRPFYSLEFLEVRNLKLLYGTLESSSESNVCVLNKQAYELLKLDTLERFITVRSNFEYKTLSQNGQKVISDKFVLNKRLKILGVVEEMSYLNTPKVFYSYVGLEQDLSNFIANEISKDRNEDVTWLELVENCYKGDLSGYSHRVFLKPFKNYNPRNGNYILDIPSQVVSQSLKDLIEASCVGMELFLGIILIGSCLIIGIVSFSSYNDDKKNSAILNVLGASKNSITDLYISETLLVGCLSLLISFLISWPISRGINALLYSLIGFEQPIKLLWTEEFIIPYFFPVAVILVTVLICYISTIIPITFSKKVCLREELKDE